MLHSNYSREEEDDERVIMNDFMPAYIIILGDLSTFSLLVSYSPSPFSCVPLPTSADIHVYVWLVERSLSA